MVAVAGAAVRLITCCAYAAVVPKERIASIRAAAFRVAVKWFVCMVRFSLIADRRCSCRLQFLVDYKFSSITNSRVSTSNIISIPPGKTLLVVISRSLCECHMNAQPRSLAGVACVLAGSKFVQVNVEVEVVAQAGGVGRRAAR